MFGDLTSSLHLRHIFLIDSFHRPDILEGLMTIYGRENFDNGKSKYFQEIRKNTEKYVLKNSSNVTEWLKKLKNGRKTFLVTGSNIDFANLTATIALGSDWRDYFDFIVTYAKKPGEDTHLIRTHLK